MDDLKSLEAIKPVLASDIKKRNPKAIPILPSRDKAEKNMMLILI